MAYAHASGTNLVLFGFSGSLGGVGNLASGEPVSGIPKLSLKPVEGLPIVTSPVQNSRVKLSAKTSNL